MDVIPPKPPARRVSPVIAAGLLALVLGAASLYALGGLDKLLGVQGGKIAEAGGECPAAKAIASRLRPLAKGELAALQVPEQPAPARPLSFQNGAGETLTLAAFADKTILLNLWATWCAPCKKEMPALDHLQANLGGDDFEVVTVNIDTRNPEKPKQFLSETGIKALAFYADPQAKIFQDLKAAGRAFGMPTTLLIGKGGCELAWLAGPAEWASPDAVTFIRAALAR